MRFINQTFTNTSVTLDDGEFHNCNFTECTLHYGGAPLEWEDCAIENVRFVFHGAAQRTLGLLQFIYQATPNGRVIVEDLLNRSEGAKGSMN
jgi:hypothetical protein